MTEHLITPPLELFKQWEDDILNERDNVDHVLDCAWRNGFQSGAGHELEACCEWLNKAGSGLAGTYAAYLRTARCPKPPSLKEQALKELAWVDKNLNMPLLNQCDAIHTIRRALEQLDD